MHASGINETNRPRHSIYPTDQGSADRYFQSKTSAPKKMVAEGVEGRVPYKGTLRDLVYQLVGGLRAGMGYCGVETIEQLRTETRFVRVSPSGHRENHPHDIALTQEAPNYNKS